MMTSTIDEDFIKRTGFLVPSWATSVKPVTQQLAGSHFIAISSHLAANAPTINMTSAALFLLLLLLCLSAFQQAASGMWVYGVCKNFLSFPFCSMDRSSLFYPLGCLGQKCSATMIRKFVSSFWGVNGNLNVQGKKETKSFGENFIMLCKDFVFKTYS